MHKSAGTKCLIELTMKATNVSDTACPLLAHSWAISLIMFLMTLSACALDIVMGLTISFQSETTATTERLNLIVAKILLKLGNFFNL